MTETSANLPLSTAIVRLHSVPTYYIGTGGTDLLKVAPDQSCLIPNRREHCKKVEARLRVPIFQFFKR